MYRILRLCFLFCFVGYVCADDIKKVADLDALSEIIDTSWTNNLFSKIIPPGDMTYNNDLRVISYEDSFETNFLSRLITTTNDTGTGTNFVLYPVKVVEITNGNDRVRHYLSAISTNPVAIYTTEVSIVNYPENWIEETYGDPPAWLNGDDLQDWYDDRDPIREYITFSLIETNSVVDYDAWLTNTLNTYIGTNTNTVLALYSNNIVFFETGIDAGDAEFYLHAPTNILTLDLFKTVTNYIDSVGWSLSATLEHTVDPLLLNSTISDSPTFFCAGDASADSDSDGLADTRELRTYNSDPENSDTDNDGLSDGEEVMTYDLDLLNPDSDGDGLLDGWEVEYGTDPTLDAVSGMVARWTFEETSGSNAIDIINGNNGTYHGTTAVAGGFFSPIFRSMYFAGPNDPDGELDGLFVPSSQTLNVSNSITLAAWVYPEVSNDVRQAVFQKGGAYYLNIDDAQLHFYWYGLTDEGYFSTTQVLPTNEWSYITAVYNGNDVRLYINGILVNTFSTSGKGDVSSDELGIGYSGGSSRHFKGNIDDARIYETALSSNQVYSLYEQGTDADHDGFTLAEEAFYNTDPNNSDTDSDKLSDYDEIMIYLTDPAVSNITADISGTVTYTGSSTGKVVVLASYTRHGWSTAISTNLNTTPSSFTFQNIPATNYWIKVFRDLNEDGEWQGNEPPNFTFTNVNLIAAGASNVTVHIEKTRGMRVDFGEYYNPDHSPWNGKNSAQIATQIVDDAVAWGVNTLYARPLSSVYGTYWLTNSTSAEYLVSAGTHGKNDILNTLIDYAHEKDLKVIAWMQPVNAFTNAWMSNTNWRYKAYNGDYAYENEFWLSPFNTNVLNWIDDVVNEVIDQGVDGIDISETHYRKYSSDYTNALTYDTAATNMYFERYPSGALGDDNWFSLRTEVLTSNIFARLGALIHERGVEYHVTSVWDADEVTGELVFADYLGVRTGFNFDQIMNIKDYARPDMVIVELIWQSEAKSSKDYDLEIFNPEWTIGVAEDYVDFVNGRVLPCIHPEITLKVFINTNNSVTISIPSLPQFEDTMYYSATNTAGCDFFIHDLALEDEYLPTNGVPGYSYGWQAVSNVFRSTP